jgi:hypothetical protein
LSLPEVSAPKGATLRASLGQIEKTTGIKPVLLIELENEEKPPEGWNSVSLIFWKLYGRISAVEIEAHARLSGEEIGPLEYEAIMAMDAEASGYLAERTRMAAG